MERFIYNKDNSHKYWEISRVGNSLTVCFGRIGSQGSQQTWEYQSIEQAKAAYNTKVTEKIKKGYSRKHDTVLVIKGRKEMETALTPDDPRWDILLRFVAFLPSLSNSTFLPGEGGGEWKVLVPLTTGATNLFDLLLGHRMVKEIHPAELIEGWIDSRFLTFKDEELQKRRMTITGMVAALENELDEIHFYRYKTFNESYSEENNDLDTLFFIIGKTREEEWYGLAPVFEECEMRARKRKSSAERDKDCPEKITILHKITGPVIKNFDAIIQKDTWENITKLVDAWALTRAELLEKLFMEVNLLEIRDFNSGFECEDFEEVYKEFVEFEEFHREYVPNRLLFELGNSIIFPMYILGETLRGDSVCFHTTVVRT